MPKSTIPLAPATSSQIHAHGYDATTNTLALQFKSKGGAGSVYHYKGVTPAMYKEFTESESLGKFFGTRIKGNTAHPHTKMVDEAAEKKGGT